MCYNLRIQSYVTICSVVLWINLINQIREKNRNIYLPKNNLSWDISKDFLLWWYSFKFLNHMLVQEFQTHNDWLLNVGQREILCSLWVHRTDPECTWWIQFLIILKTPDILWYLMKLPTPCPFQLHAVYPILWLNRI